MRDRFMEFQEDRVRFRDARGEFHEVMTQTLDQLYEAIHHEHRLRRPRNRRLPRADQAK